MKEEMEKPLHRLYALLEQEIREYRCLIEELKEEAKTLQKNSSDSLMQAVHRIEGRTSAIVKLNRSVQDTIEGMMTDMKMDPSEKNLDKLVTVLPPPERRRIEGYRETLARLREWIGRINARNRSFIEEAANYWKGLFTILNQEVADSPVYIQDGRKKSPGLPPYSLNRKV
jgi:hypothetical protein